MKKIIIIMLLMVVTLSTTVHASVGTKEATLNYMGITINIDNVEVVPRDVNGNVVNPFTINGTTYLPVRAISEALGKTVNWDAETRTVQISDGSGDYKLEDFSGKSDKKISQETKNLYYNDILIKINGETIEPKDANGILVEPFTIDGTTYLPVRAVAEAFNKKVDWNGETKTVFISSNMDDEIAKINNVIIKVLDNTLCAEVTSDIPINIFNHYSLIEASVVAEPYLNLRSDVNTNSNIIATIPNGSDISIKDVVSINNNQKWYKVSYSGETGFVSADYVETKSVRLVLDLNNTNFNIPTSTKDINYDIIDAIRFGDQGNNVSRIVLDLNQISECKVVQNEDKTITYFALNKDFKIPASVKGEDVFVATNDDKLYLPKDEVVDDKNKIDKEEIKKESGDIVIDDNKEEIKKESGDIVIDDDKEEIEKESGEIITDNDKIEEENLSTVDSIKYSSSTNKTKVKIDGDYEYTAFSLTNPDRVVFDIKGVKLNVDGPKEINPNNKNITAIRFSQNEKDIVRIVFDVNVKSDYLVTEKNGEMVIELEEKSYKNIDYINYGTYATLILQDTDIDYFNVQKSSNSSKYYFTYSSKKFKSGTGTIEINDDFVEDIIIKSSKITIMGEDNVSYSMRQVGDNVVITIKEKSEIEERIILLDAGHGGTDPGACNGNIYEKDYNLKIALKLYEMLEETDGIEVRISRDNDTYISRDGRLEFVLDNADADLVISIHNNSLANKNYQGTMVLYYNKPGEKEDYGITSKEFAQIVQDNLVSELETTDRGIVNRDDLWILTQNNVGERPDWESTNIPSILCEVVYISNDKEAARLQTDEFQQKAAQAVYDGIIEAISIMNND